MGFPSVSRPPEAHLLPSAQTTRRIALKYRESLGTDLNTIVEKDIHTCWPFAWPPGQAEGAAVNRAERSRALWRAVRLGKGVESDVKKGNDKTKTCIR